MTKTNQFAKARKAGVPIVCLEICDPAASIQDSIAHLNGKAEIIPLIVWDIIQGVKGLNPPGIVWCQSLPDQQTFQGNPVGVLAAIASNPPCHEAEPTEQGPGARTGGVLFVHNAQRFLEQIDFVQAVWNCRDALKSAGFTLVLLSPSFHLPPEIARDCVVISEPLPDEEQLGGIVDRIYDCAGIAKPEAEERKRILDTLLGLGAFEAEQVLSLSVTKNGIDSGALWDRKVKAIEATQGLSVYKGKEKFADVGGLENAKSIIGKTIAGKSEISCLVLIDEADKAFSASGSDMSGTTQDQVKTMLCYMQDEEILGILALGPPGVGKTVLCKAAANEYGIPLIMLDMGALKGSLVGQSEQNMRQALKVIHAVSDGRALFIAACNRTESIPPELRRRFSYSSIFFDLPDRDELDSIWRVWRAKYELTKGQCDTVRDDGWTGSEVRNCCLKAWAMECKLSEAATTIVPISRSAADIVQGLRNSASGKYISASKPGIYSASATPAASVTSSRKMDRS